MAVTGNEVGKTSSEWTVCPGLCIKYRIVSEYLSTALNAHIQSFEAFDHIGKNIY
jgi:hypothetical protein